jgi:hypothetical protein
VGSGPSETFFWGHAAKADWLKILTPNWKDLLSFVGVTMARSGRVDLYSQQIMILRKMKTYST